MATPRTVVVLSTTQRAELVRMRDTDPKPYIRERAAAILKVAAGYAVYQVAQTGLFRRRCPETVAEWIARFQQGGVAALQVRAGRGRKPAFSPSAPHRRQRRR
jgi:transposase